MKKTINKWDIISPTQRKIGKILKTIALITFLSTWLPVFAYTLSQIGGVIAQVIKIIIK